MERRAASHTEEEEMNQRRRLLNQARKGEPKAIKRLFELYQVRVYSGANLKKLGRLPMAPTSPARGRGAQASRSTMGSKALAVRGRPAAKPAFAPAAKPAFAPAAKPAFAPAAKPVLRPVAKPTLKPAAKPTLRRAAKPALRKVLHKKTGRRAVPVKGAKKQLRRSARR